MKTIFFLTFACAVVAGCSKPNSQENPPKTAPATVAAEPKVVSSAPPKTYDGPFGLASGMTLKELEDLGFTPIGSAPGLYKGKPPRPLEGSSDYSVVAMPKAGLCRIQSTVDVQTVNGSGDQLKAETDRLAEMMRVKYGKYSNKVAYAKQDVYQRNPEYWMLGLKEDSVVYAYDWGPSKTEKPLPDDMHDIEIEATTRSISSGWVAIRYTFKNFDACLEELKVRKAANL